MAEAANPLDPTYYANLAALEHQERTTLGQDRRGREQANASSRFAKGELTRAAPQRYAANRNNANSRGLLESGQLAQTQGQTQADFANKQARVGEQRRQAIERLNENDANAKKDFEIGNVKAQTESFQRSKEELERNPPAAAAAPQYPTMAAQVGGTPDAKGVVPYTSVQPGAGYVKVGQPLLAQRAAAARKAAGTPKSKALKGWGVG